MATLFKTNKEDIVGASLINKIFEKLQEIREKHNISGTFDTEIARADAIIGVGYPTLIKEDLLYLSDNSYYTKRPENSRKQRITSYYPDAIAVPSVDDLILAEQRYNDYVDIINELDGVCVHCDDHANYNVHSDYNDCGYNFSNCTSYYCQACTYDFPINA